MSDTLSRLRKIALIACCGLVFGAIPAKAQFVGYVSPQTVGQQLATNTACTGGIQLFVIANLGQVQHIFSASSGGNATFFDLFVQGVDSAGTTYFVGDQLVLGNATSGNLFVSGYYPKLQASVQCSAGSTFTLSYSGSSATTPVFTGGFLAASQYKNVATGIAANTTFNALSFPTPYGDSSGLIVAQYSGASLAGSTITVQCTTPNGIGLGNSLTQTLTLANNQNLQVFKVPAGKCQTAKVNYISGGATAATIVIDYAFDAPGLANTHVANYSHITGTTATAVKAGAGVAATLTIGTPAAGTVSLFDLASASCTGTPATNVVSVITALAGGAPVSFPLNLFFGNGICVKASVAMDLTVGFQ